MIEVGLTQTELCRLFEKYGSDKYFYYSTFYYELLNGRRESVKKVLELGIGYPELMLDSLSRVGRKDYTTGASIFAWRDFFPNAEIYALDNRRDILINEGRIRSFWCDQTDASTYPLAQLGGDFDLIVDDGLHEKEPQLTAIETLLPLLAENGIYIVEDVGYLDHDARRDFSYLIWKGIPMSYRSELYEFRNPKLGEHVAAIIVVCKWT